jgi:hypothetical protein
MGGPAFPCLVKASIRTAARWVRNGGTAEAAHGSAYTSTLSVIADMPVSRPRAKTGLEQMQQTTYTNAPLFDDLVGAQQESFRDLQAQRFGGGQVDDEIELGRLLDRNVRGLRPTQNLVDEIGAAME